MTTCSSIKHLTPTCRFTKQNKCAHRLISHGIRHAQTMTLCFLWIPLAFPPSHILGLLYPIIVSIISYFLFSYPGSKAAPRPGGIGSAAAGQPGMEGDSVLSKILPGGAAEQAGKLGEGTINRSLTAHFKQVIWPWYDERFHVSDIISVNHHYVMI